MNPTTNPETALVPPRVILIRHGESEANAGLPTPSPTAIRLTARGHEQAAALAARIQDRPDLIVTSPYLRTQETAAPFARRHRSVPTEVWPVQEFTYLDIARYAGTTEAARSTAVAEYWDRSDPLWNDGGGAESFADFIGRVDAALLRLRERVGQTVVVFTHGYVIHALETRLARPDEPVDARFMACFRKTWPDNAPDHCEQRYIWRDERYK